MNETVAIINQILEEHKVIIRHAIDLERVTNDAEALKALQII